jgi:hypothetical protein
MMLKQKIVIFIMLLNLIGNAQSICPSFDSFNFDSGLPNPCTKYYFRAVTIQSSYPGSTSYNITYNFGDGSALVTYTLPTGYYTPSLASHSYLSPGVYTVSVTVSGITGSTCTPSTITQSISVNCSTCQTYSVLSTGYDRANNQIFAANEGNFDPYWQIFKKQYIGGPPNYTPISGSEIYYPVNTLAYDIVPNGGYGTSLATGNAKYISISSTSSSQDPARNIVTYRTYFNLPNPLPSNKSYSLALSMRGDDAIHKVALNDVDIKPVGYSILGSSYSGLPLVLSISSCDTGYFKPGSNYLDISLGDLALAATQLSSEVLLYECPTTCSVVSCPTAIGANYQVNTCPQSAPECQGKCKSIEGTLLINNPANASYSVTMNYGDGTASQNLNVHSLGASFIHPYSNGTYTVTATISGPGACTSTYTFVASIICTPPPCSDCIGSFAPIPDSTYIISAWVKEANAAATVTTYVNAKINVSFYTGSSPVGTPVLAIPSGQIIDGWQKIEQKFKIPATATTLKLNLITSVQDANFDDIRVFPFNGSMKSYVYDPYTMRLMAELDERNYATFYEYDEEGRLIRVKKETEKGIMTIKESRNNTPIKQ